MRRAKVFVNGVDAGELQEIVPGSHFRFAYDEGYKGPSVSLTMPLSQKIYEYDRFPPFFEGLLPEGILLEGLLKGAKLDRNDLFGQLVKVGQDLVGNVTIREIQ